MNQRVHERNNKLLDDYQTFLSRIELLAENTIATYMSVLKNTRIYLGEEYTSMDYYTSEMIGKFISYLMEHKSCQTLHVYIYGLSKFYDYLKTKKIILERPIPEINLKALRRKQGEYISGVLTAPQIFEVRRRTLDIRVAASFECLLSTGLRRSELQQVRACDIKWGMSPVDTTTGKPSKYICATIPMRTKYHSIKRGEERDVFVNNITGKLLKRYMSVVGIKNTVPIFPFYPQIVQEWISYACFGIYDPKKHPCVLSDIGNDNDDDHVRSKDFSDVKLEDTIGLNSEFLRVLNINKQTIERFSQKYKQYKQLSDADKVAPVMHPHGLRHVFCNVQYYRSYTGRRKDIQETRVMMGHKSFDSTKKYMDRFQAVSTDEEWERLQNGKSMDHMYALHQTEIDFTKQYGECYNVKYDFKKHKE